MNTNSGSVDVIAQWATVTAQVGEIRKLLGTAQQAEIEAELGPSSAGDEIRRRVAELAAQLRSVFEHEESDGFIADLYDAAPQCSDALDQLKHERSQLLGTLDDISELAGQPGTSYAELQRRFQRFVADLSHHERTEDMLVLRATNDQAGLMD